ncbi:hypothetical protein AA309_29590 [Microvirga vignae]|uniref:Uncharacterized protein n=1 Tax=Microvirga vignae TaxID=1225564 RepID=A0A0H1R4L7_9HYPH|nr:hypothetical protein AA309_29590 [Microvirga vignae]
MCLKERGGSREQRLKVQSGTALFLETARRYVIVTQGVIRKPKIAQDHIGSEIDYIPFIAQWAFADVPTRKGHCFQWSEIQ